MFLQLNPVLLLGHIDDSQRQRHQDQGKGDHDDAREEQTNHRVGLPVLTSPGAVGQFGVIHGAG